MGLFTRLSGETDKISVHAFNSAVRLWANGSAFVTRLKIISAFSLVGDEVTELDAIKAVYVGKAAETDKNVYLMIVEDADILVELGFYNEAQWKTEIEI